MDQTVSGGLGVCLRISTGWTLWVKYQYSPHCDVHAHVHSSRKSWQEYQVNYTNIIIVFLILVHTVDLLRFRPRSSASAGFAHYVNATMGVTS